MRVKIVLLEPGTLFVQSSRHATKTVTRLSSKQSFLGRLLGARSIELNIDPNELLVLKPQGARTPDGQPIKDGSGSALMTAALSADNVTQPIEGRDPTKLANTSSDNFLGDSRD